MKWLALSAIRFYQRHLRGLHNKKCIYTPSCSHYGILAIEKYGLAKGAIHTFARIKRCNGALYKGGIDCP
ncbi:MAG: membrane protein insertion efficiency factor YidD [Alphaproteobacteria bacterium]|nr:membrane protein insertion efficiency factor YidD [Alphaproteobacteria bacterium]